MSRSQNKGIKKNLDPIKKKPDANKSFLLFASPLAVVALVALLLAIGTKTQVSVWSYLNLGTPPLANNDTRPHAANEIKQQGNMRAEDEQNTEVESLEDEKIKGKLAIGERFLEMSKFTEAESFFRNLAKTYPKSVKARYGLGRAVNGLASEKQSNKLLEEAINILGEAMGLPDVSTGLLKKIGLLRAERQEFRGFTKDAAKTLELVQERLPDDVEVLGRLGVAYLHNEGTPKYRTLARITFEKMLLVHKNSYFALAHLGFILQNHDRNSSEAAALLTAALGGDDERVLKDARFYYHAGDALNRIGEAAKAAEVFQRAANRGLFLSALQRSTYNVDRLTGKPWWDMHDLPKAYQHGLQTLRDNWELIRDEGLAQINATTGLFEVESENLRDYGDWKQFTLFAKGQKVVKACQSVPKTCQLVENIPDAAGCKRGQVKYSLLMPGTHVWPHCGPTNCRIRPHLGLRVPPGASIKVGGITKTWKEGDFIILDDSFEHEVWHNGTAPRLIFIVDMWHPEITANEKRSLTSI